MCSFSHGGGHSLHVENLIGEMCRCVALDGIVNKRGRLPKTLNGGPEGILLRVKT